MRIVKRLYTFMLRQYIPLLVMTFCISLFVVLMQFLWRFIEDLVGKGLTFDIIAQLFFYAALTFVPTALPLAVLLASLMTFGNLGEKFELTAMKAAGISLFRIMKPLIAFMVAVAIGAFLFQNYAMPIAQTKMWTILFSMRQKTPEVEIPERTFYDQIPGMSLYVEKKNPDTGMLYDMIIYDRTRGMDNSRVILADSGRINFTEDKTRLFLHLYKGEMFENLRGSELGLQEGSNYLPFRRESFSDKQIYLAFDANFNMIDEEAMRSQYIGKNVAELMHSIDSIGLIVDSIGNVYAHDIKTRSYVDVTYYQSVPTDSGYALVPRQPVAAGSINVDSVLRGPSPSTAKSYAQQALAKANRQRLDYEYRSAVLIEQGRLMRRHDIEMQRKFTLPVACLVFFFIGAPLGAIIKKGGIGTPLVISVFLFIVYFIFDNMGFKMAREGRIEVWVGIWLSTAVMLPLGIFFTYKAVGDSAVFNIDAYKLALSRLFGLRGKRRLELKEVVMNDVDPDRACEQISLVASLAAGLSQQGRRPLWSRLLHPADYAPLNQAISDLVEHLSNTRSPRVVALLNNYPFSVNHRGLQAVIDNTEKLSQELACTIQNQPIA